MRSNTLEHKPNFSLHRSFEDGTAITPETSNLTTFLSEPNRSKNAINCKGWNSIDGVVFLTGGTNVTFQVLELIKYTDPATNTEVEKLVQRSPNIGPFVDGDHFTLTVHEGSILLRLHAVTGAVTKAELLVSGAEKAVVGVR